MTPTPTSTKSPAAGSRRIDLASVLSGFALGAVLATFAWVQVLPNAGGAGGGGANEFVLLPGDVPADQVVAEQAEDGTVTRRVIGGGEGTESAGGRASGGLALDDGSAGGSVGSGGAAGASGGGTTTGVSASEIKLGATYVGDGIAEAFLGEVRLGMEAVRNRVNRAGGIHGRQLEIKYQDDAWDPQRGKSFIENLIVQDKVFALAVSPSSEGLNQASNAGLFQQHKVPVVGADGLNNTQFTDPWIWPVATATTTNVHIIMKDAWGRCQAIQACKDVGLRPAIVFGNTYRFGVEGAFAFSEAYRRLSGQSIPGFNTQNSCNKDSRYCGIDATKNQYTGEIQTVQDACKARDGLPACNFLLLLLEPKTAQDWMRGFDAASTYNRAGGCCGMAGAQPLFTSNFGDNCRSQCDGLVVWTGYNPPIGEFETRQEVARYTQELTAQSSSADVNNQFTLGGYVGMELLVHALTEVGPDLTREKLVETLNSLAGLETGLTAAKGLAWTSDARYANHSAHGYKMKWESNSSRFAGFERVTGYVRDSDWLGQDNKAPT